MIWVGFFGALIGGVLIGDACCAKREHVRCLFDHWFGK